MPGSAQIDDLIADYKAKGEAFALATVVRTVSVTAAKAGAKAVILANGAISGGWIGGGCARGAVLRAAREALADGQPRLVSVQPPNALQQQSLSPGDTRDGVHYARNMCPSEGTIDVFVEPVLPRPKLTICGASPVAVALAELAGRMGFFVVVCASADDHSVFGEVDQRIEGFAIPPGGAEHGYFVVSTQGGSDNAALEATIRADAKYYAFVGSRKKAAALKSDLIEAGVDPALLEKIRAPAGLDLGAVTPDEIAFSIVAEMIQIHRRGQNKNQQ